MNNNIWFIMKISHASVYIILKPERKKHLNMSVSQLKMEVSKSATNANQ